jgi:hypothetical protein
MQNLALAGFVAPHCGHLISSGLAHSMQNLAASGLSVWHLGHCMGAFLAELKAESLKQYT